MNNYKFFVTFIVIISAVGIFTTSHVASSEESPIIIEAPYFPKTPQAFGVPLIKGSELKWSQKRFKFLFKGKSPKNFDFESYKKSHKDEYVYLSNSGEDGYSINICSNRLPEKKYFPAGHIFEWNK